MNCGVELKLNNTRDIERKKYCSRKCIAQYQWENGIHYGRLINDETKKKMRDSKLRLLKEGWSPVGWKKYNIKPRISNRGYIFKGTKRLHTLIVEKCINRKLNKNEVVHHIDGNKLNNDPNNLFVMPRSVHQKLHTYLRKINCQKVSKIA